MNVSSSQTSYAGLMNNSYQGIQRNLIQFDEASARISEGDVSPDNIGSQMESEALVKANMAALRSADSLIGTLLDVKV
jgi:hypothetical protein